MGYTHYWTWKRAPTAEEMQDFLDRVRPVLMHGEAAGIIGAYDGRGSTYQFGPSGIAFNGIKVEAHESMHVPGNTKQGVWSRPGAFNFCKTAHKEYDPYVCAVLMVAREVWADDVLDISSDGMWDEHEYGGRTYPSDWTEGKVLFFYVYDRAAPEDTLSSEED